MENITTPEKADLAYIEGFEADVKTKSDQFINYFLIAFFVIGLLLAMVYDTWKVALIISLPLLSAYYVTKTLLPKSNLYQYVLSAVLGIFMAQFIYQMHGMFEMHFFAFIGSAILITYQNWRLQIPIAIIVVLHHAIFGYLQYLGNDDIFFSQLDYMDLQTFLIHILLAIVIFFLCGLWAHHIKEYANKHIQQNYTLGKLQKNEEQNNLLRKTNLELDKFAYSVSHDLRAPLLSMKGIIDITDMMTDEEITKKHMVMLRESADKLDTFITDIHNYSRNSRQEIKLQMINFDELLNGLNQQMAYMNGTRAVDIQILTEGNDVFISDKYRVQMVLNNLISNAIRYQKIENENPYVKIKVKINSKDAEISIEDNGIGIEQENYHQIFEMFYRVSDQSKGSGLGLYIVKETVDVLKGSISLTSKKNEGTTFLVKLPNNN
ncbi:sensor histidine kinase [Flavobacterium seoulense]|uniref:histidine kinase n=1 Tax=Flavobacterium seoulense TaxID=1492738 RepID=A0A066X0H0_9FLAO|nr:HAMP domain-containing sensor histidine kinase [Flavobacterium seoulense]KDN56385.1 histidine kinase [Flavobacterium seoulense]